MGIGRKILDKLFYNVVYKVPENVTIECIYEKLDKHYCEKIENGILTSNLDAVLRIETEPKSRKDKTLEKVAVFRGLPSYCAILQRSVKKILEKQGESLSLKREQDPGALESWVYKDDCDEEHFFWPNSINIP
ncbi:hypothetical protein HN924_01995 [Candidatus Woesearchaeota archaeon]|jgi:hypothetical protein|nr:hypothetical protein [Candidatus Woesearchaeota archaeon]MBT7402859.1 hypothetical protein [Candidatus Woesearchaeota archaeon]